MWLFNSSLLDPSISTLCKGSLKLEKSIHWTEQSQVPDDKCFNPVTSWTWKHIQQIKSLSFIRKIFCLILQIPWSMKNLDFTMLIYKSRCIVMAALWYFLVSRSFVLLYNVYCPYACPTIFSPLPPHCPHVTPPTKASYPRFIFVCFCH